MLPHPEAQRVLTAVEECYDAIPRVSAYVEEIGPFTLFVARTGVSWDFYARPRLGAGDISADDVRRLLAAQRERGVPQTLEWVDDVTPSLTDAVRAAAPRAALQVVPLLAAEVGGVEPPADGRTRVLAADDPELGLAIGTVGAGFGGHDVVEPADPAHRPALISQGHLVVVAGYDRERRLVGSGSAASRGSAAELMGIATLPSSRRQGVAGDVTRALVAAVRAQGVTTVFLTAASEAAAGVYRRVGFERVGTGMILDAG